MSTPHPDDSDYSRKQSREDYEKLLGIVEHNTGDAQPALARRSSILTSAQSAGMDRATARSKLNAAVENGDLATWNDRVFRTDEASLVAVITDLRDLIMRCNQLMQEDGDA